MNHPMVFPDIDPILVHLGPVPIRWYALAYITGLLLAWWGIIWALKRTRLWAGPPFGGKPPATEDQVGDLLVWATFGVILGGRLGWDLIYGTVLCSVSPYAGFCRGYPQAFLDNPLKLFAAWEGGMSFHGGLAGVALAVWLFCRRQKLKLLPISDLVCAFAPVGLFFGRLANFVNGELWGRVTTSPFGMVFCNARILANYGGLCPAGDAPRHPSQLYEAVSEGLLLLIILQLCLHVFRLNRRPGLLSAIFFFGYGTFRFINEFFREPDAPFLGPVSMGMALSIPIWLAAAALFVVSSRKRA